MWSDSTALERQQHRQAFRQRLRESQRQDLFAAARVLVPELGIAVVLGRIAVHAGLSRHAAQALFNTTGDLATALVRHAWHALIEAVTGAAPASPADLLARLIAAIRADAPAHRIHRALSCGAAAWQRADIAAADCLLARAIGQELAAFWPVLDFDRATAIGRRAVALARDAALRPAAPDAQAEATLIAAMLAAISAASVDRPAQPARNPAKAVPTTAPSRPARPPPHRRAPGAACPSHPAHPPPPNPVHDPPANAV